MCRCLSMRPSSTMTLINDSLASWVTKKNLVYSLLLDSERSDKDGCCWILLLYNISNINISFTFSIFFSFCLFWTDILAIVYRNPQSISNGINFRSYNTHTRTHTSHIRILCIIKFRGPPSPSGHHTTPSPHKPNKIKSIKRLNVA